MVDLVYAMGRKWRVNSEMEGQQNKCKCGVELTGEEKDHSVDECFDCYAKDLEDVYVKHPDDVPGFLEI